MKTIERGTVVVLTHNRKGRLQQTLSALMRATERWSIIVVDNGSTDGTAKLVAQEFPSVMLIRCRRNLGAAARNIAVAYAHTPYVAFCDDDTFWLPGALQRAARILDEHPNIGGASGCIVEAGAGRVDPVCLEMASSPLDREDLPGPQVLGLKAGACIVRTRAFYEAGGFWPPFFIGGEEALLALDMADRGWRLVYLEDVLAQRVVSLADGAASQQRREWRNAIWVAWMRLPFRFAWKVTLEQLRSAARDRQLRSVLMLVMAGFARVLKKRRVVSPRVAAMWKHVYVDRSAMSAEGETAAQMQQRSLHGLNQ